jgi:serine/threonine-protein kinase
MTKITTSEPEPVSTVKQGLGADIDAVVKKAMAKKPKDRFASGMDMAIALRECARFMRA